MRDLHVRLEPGSEHVSMVGLIDLVRVVPGVVRLELHVDHPTSSCWRSVVAVYVFGLTFWVNEAHR